MSPQGTANFSYPFPEGSGFAAYRSNDRARLTHHAQLFETFPVALHQDEYLSLVDWTNPAGKIQKDRLKGGLHAQVQLRQRAQAQPPV